MKIIPHPELLKKREKELNQVQSNLAQRARELHVLEIMINSQVESEKRRVGDRKIYQLAFFLSGFVAGFLFAFIH